MQTNGEWMPDVEGSGNVKESYISLFALKEAPEGKYILKIQHAMREEDLKGILNVGFKINKIQ
jgi:gliding motility-associated lipoprotein GldH